MLLYYKNTLSAPQIPLFWGCDIIIINAIRSGGKRQKTWKNIGFYKKQISIKHSSRIPSTNIQIYKTISSAILPAEAATNFYLPTNVPTPFSTIHTCLPSVHSGVSRQMWSSSIFSKQLAVTFASRSGKATPNNHFNKTAYWGRYILLKRKFQNI